MANYYDSIDTSINFPHCHKCGEPLLQWMLVPIMNRYVIVNHRCKCQLEADKEYDERKKAEEKQRRIKASLSRIDYRVGDPNRFHFENAIETKGITLCRKYVEKFPEARKTGAGLILCGDTGNGKTFASGCVLNALVEKYCIAPVWTSAMQLTIDFKNFDMSVFDYLHNVDFIIIDDYGVQPKTETNDALFYEVIDTIYRHKIPYIITTNYPPEQIAKPKGIKESRIFDRLNETGQRILFDNEKLRKPVRILSH